MDIAQLYMASPDWIKGLMVILPHLTLYATARLFFTRQRAMPVRVAAGQEPAEPLRPALLERIVEGRALQGLEELPIKGPARPYPAPQEVR